MKYTVSTVNGKNVEVVGFGLVSGKKAEVELTKEQVKLLESSGLIIISSPKKNGKDSV